MFHHEAIIGKGSIPHLCRINQRTEAEIGCSSLGRTASVGTQVRVRIR